jgi:hypothetical protein
MPTYQPRLVDDLIRELMADLPALFIVGPACYGQDDDRRALRSHDRSA